MEGPLCAFLPANRDSDAGPDSARNRTREAEAEPEAESTPEPEPEPAVTPTPTPVPTAIPNPFHTASKSPNSRHKYSCEI
jgi:ABC-type uncharacterized transport system involved in gliding motility auxiliary subunit